MNISDIYTNRVSNKRISFASNLPMPPFERDQNILNLEKTVFNKFKEVGALDDENQTVKNKNNFLKSFSLEDAIKDLLNIRKISK